MRVQRINMENILINNSPEYGASRQIECLTPQQGGEFEDRRKKG